MQPRVSRRIIVSVPEQVQNTAAERYSDQGKLKPGGRETGLDWIALGRTEEGCHHGKL